MADANHRFSTLIGGLRQLITPITTSSGASDGGKIAKTDPTTGKFDASLIPEGAGQGADGDSAYQVWIAAGNSGTVQDFLDSLVGAKGDKGDTGDAGQDGNAGQDGDDGQAGDQWTNGAGAPSDSTVQVFDTYYLNTTNGDVHRKAQGASTWSNIGNIKGDTGAKGDTGDAGQDGDTHVPDPSGEADGKHLEVSGGALVYVNKPSGGSGACEVVDSGTISSAVSSLSITGLDFSSYQYFTLVADGYHPATDSQELRVKLYDASTHQNINFLTSRHYTRLDGNVHGNYYGGTTGYFPVNSGAGTTGEEGLRGLFLHLHPVWNGRCSIQFGNQMMSAVPNQQAYWGWTVSNGTISDYDEVELYFGVGNIDGATAATNWVLYGWTT